MITTQPANLSRPAPTPAATPQSTVERMADAMRALAFSGHTVDAEALGLKDFTTDEIEANWRAARDLATASSVRRVS